jgi:hypothetical protein
MFVEIPDHQAVDVSIMLAAIGAHMIREQNKVPTELHMIAPVFNELLEDEEGKGDFFETIAQKFPDLTNIIRNDSRVRSQSVYKNWG